jgi:DNA processing protein
VVAVVGSRRPSQYGQEVAYNLAYGLAEVGCVVVSGLALGIDALAHRACLDAGGRTVAVLGTAIDDLAPATNRALGEKIADRGAVLSEYAPGMAVNTRWSFARRDQLMAALADAVIVVEAVVRSGALITAAAARQYGREVWAVPGNITSRLSAGCNRLLSEGARVVTGVVSVVAALTGVRQMELPVVSESETGAGIVGSEVVGVGGSWGGHDRIGDVWGECGRAAARTD